MGIDPRYLCALRSTTTNVRNFCILAHVDHGMCMHHTAHHKPIPPDLCPSNYYVLCELMCLVGDSKLEDFQLCVSLL